MKKIYYFFIAIVILILIILIALPKQKYPEINRLDKIPSSSIKMNPQTDLSTVKSLSDEYYDPIPLSSTINSAGAEDSPFILPDGKTLYFFFTPDVKVPVEKQILDETTGIYVSKKINNEFTIPERVWLQKPGKLSLDGCEFITPDEKTMLFCSVREGYDGINWFSAESKNGKWEFMKKVEFPEDYKVGELHEYNNELYFHSDRSGGKGQLDIWKIKRNPDTTWTSPENVESINSESSEGWPALSPDGNELWISKDYGIWRSKKINGEWSKPEKMFSPLAGEASIDNQGNVYFVHHFFDKNQNMIEADIYVAIKR